MPPYINVKPLRQMHSDIIVNGADGYRETPPSSSRYSYSIRVHAYSTHIRRSFAHI